MSALKTLAAATISAAMMATASAAPVAQTETVKVEVTESQIDEIGGVIYSQIQKWKSRNLRSMRLAASFIRRFIQDAPTARFA